MAKTYKALLALAAVLALCLTVAGAALGAVIPIDQVAAIQTAPDGNTVLALYDGDTIRLRLVDGRGTVRREAGVPRKQGKRLRSVTDMAVDSGGLVYLLCDYLDESTGEYAGQELCLYDLGAVLQKRAARHEFEPGAPVRYRWLGVTSSVALMGTDRGGGSLVREVYDPAALYSRALPAPAGSRTYPLNREEGIWKAVAAGSNTVYASKSGKIFVAEEGAAQPREVYPARVLTQLMYPMFLAPQSAEAVYILEQESGDILSLSLSDGSTSLLKSGTEPFSGVSGLAPADLRALSMTDPQNFSALARGDGEEGFTLLTAFGGSLWAAQGLRRSLGGFLLRTALSFLGWTAACLLPLGLGYGFYRLLGRGRTILAKLALSSIPLLAAALAVFGVFSYQAYSSAIRQSFQKQVEDEGNLLTALFGTESFGEIEYPYDYTGEAYAYLSQQMSTRPIRTATAYYERQELFIGVDFAYPCFYPFDIRLDAGARELYLRAAYTGRAQTGVLDDAGGRRVVCVTPVGGASGGTVYLLETGILTANLERYTGSYLRGYVLVSLLFLLAIGGILMALFTRVLAPIREIREGLESFARGERAVRLETSVADEFSGIVRIFNKMAGDIEAQMYSLRKQSETYFRFIPRRMLQLLGKENLGEVELGSGSGRELPVLCADMELGTGLFPQREQELTNRFFNILNRAADRCGATLMTDSVNLRRLRVVCPGGEADAVEIALAVLAEVDAVNAGLPMQNRMRPLLLVHKAYLYYGVCGDQDRLVPALLSQELDFFAASVPKLRQLGCRLLVSEAACEGLPEDRYARRFIGYPDQNVRRACGLYDFYDAVSPEVTRLLEETGPTFGKAMELFQEGRWQEAKNLFALVLRENQYDDVARYYVFLCEKNL